MARLFSHAQPIDFGIGYKWRTPNLLAAVNTTAPAEVAHSDEVGRRFRAKPAACTD